MKSELQCHKAVGSTLLAAMILVVSITGCGRSDPDAARSTESTNQVKEATWEKRLAEVEQTYAPKAAGAQATQSATHVTTSVEGVPERAVPGEEYELALVVEVAEGWHINANPASFDYLIPTKLSLEQDPGVQLSDIRYPKGAALTLGQTKQTLSVYEKTVRIPFRIALDADIKAGKHTVAARLSVQACDDEICLAPSLVPVAFTLDIPGN